MDYWTSTEYDDNGKITHMIRWLILPSGQAIQLAKWSV